MKLGHSLPEMGTNKEGFFPRKIQEIAVHEFVKLEKKALKE